MLPALNLACYLLFTNYETFVTINVTYEQSLCDAQLHNFLTAKTSRRRMRFVPNVRVRDRVLTNVLREAIFPRCPPFLSGTLWYTVVHAVEVRVITRIGISKLSASLRYPLTGVYGATVIAAT